MTDDVNKRHPSRLAPLSLGATPPLYRDEDEAGYRRAAIIITAVVGLVAVVGVVTWFGPTGLELVDNPAAAQTTTGQGGEPTMALQD